MPHKDIQKKREYMRTYRQQAAKKPYKHSDKVKVKAAKKLYDQSDERKAQRKAYNAALSAKSRSRPRGHDLYIMKIPNHENWYKVGCAADPHYRAKHMSAGYPWKVEIVKVYDGCGEYETTIHNKLKPFMISGENKKLTEWFEISEDELTKQIEDILLVELF